MHKKTKRILILVVSLLVFILLIISSIQIYLSLNILRGNDVLIDLSSNKDYFLVENKEPVSLHFSTVVKTNPFCTATCSYEFRDLSTGELIDAEKFSLYASIPKEKTYEVSTDFGEGIKLYNFAVSCISNATLFCRTNENPTSRYISVAVEHKLNREQQELQGTVETEQDELLSLLNRIADINASIHETVKNIPYKTEVQTQSLETQFVEKQKNFRTLQPLFRTQNYEPLQEQLNKIRPELLFIIEMFSEQQDMLKKNISQYNIDIQTLQKIRSSLINMTTLVITHQSMKDQISQLAANFNATLEQITSNKTLQQISIDVSDLNAQTKAVYQRAEDAQTITIDKVKKEMKIVHSSICDYSNCSTFQVTTTFQNTTSFCEYLSRLNATIENTPLHVQVCSFTNTSLKYVTLHNLSMQSIKIPSLLSTVKPEKQCCIDTKCQPCCTDKTCRATPIIFIHGHAIDKDTPPDYNIDSFNNLQEALEQEGIINMGRISLYQYDIPQGVWGAFGQPISLKTSYYYDVYEDHQDSIIVQTKNENIDTYAVRIKDTIDKVLYWTGSNKVIIIAHSMGGLVIRRYMQIFGTDKVEKVLTAGSPHNGTFGIIADLCPVFGEELECRDMKAGSLFMKKLNSQPLPNIPFANIVAVGCDMNEEQGDGVVLKRSAWLPTINNTIVQGDCKGTDTLHTSFIRDFQKNKTFYTTVLDFLEM